MTSARKPGVPFSTRKPFSWPSALSRAHTTVTSAKLALPIQRLCPLMTYSSRSLRAVASSATESEPCSGSVSAKAPNASSRASRASRGSQRCRRSSEPSRWIAFITSPDWMARKAPRLP